MKVIERSAFESGGPRRRGGFTLLELMIVVSILAIMASVAIPKFADMLLVSQEGGTRGNLGAMRSALSIYYGDNQGVYPSCIVAPASNVFSTYLSPKYISNIQNVTNGLHPSVNTVYCDTQLTAGNVHDGQGWYYDGDQTDSLFGNVYVACDHTDTKGNSWTSY
jgi:prepilin-type N-terminal cleavage/methylation domain-containing protein